MSYRRMLQCVCFLCLLTVQIAVPVITQAETQPDLSAGCSLSLSERDPIHGGVLPQTGYTVRRIAAVENGIAGLRYTYTEEYVGNGMPLDVSQNGFAEHLAAYAAFHSLHGISAEADETGNVCFSDLESGLYLVVQHKSADRYYAARPFVVSLPMRASDGGWIYHVSAEPKTAPLPEHPQSVQLEVKKQWADAGTVDRPRTVAVALCRDGIPVETVELSEENDWSYRWSALDTAHVWSAAEPSVADGYTVHYETRAQVITLINERTILPTPTPKPPLMQTGFRSRQLWIFTAIALLITGAGIWLFVSKEKR